MSWKLLGSTAAALALLAFLGSSAPAEAHRSGGHPGGYGGGPRMAFVGPHHQFHHHRFVAGYYYPYYASYDDGCYWLRRRALYTGNPYWWERYDACRYGYGYGY